MSTCCCSSPLAPLMWKRRFSAELQLNRCGCATASFIYLNLSGAGSRWNGNYRPWTQPGPCSGLGGCCRALSCSWCPGWGGQKRNHRIYLFQKSPGKPSSTAIPLHWALSPHPQGFKSLQGRGPWAAVQGWTILLGRNFSPCPIQTSPGTTCSQDRQNIQFLAKY